MLKTSVIVIVMAIGNDETDGGRTVAISVAEMFETTMSLREAASLADSLSVA